MKNGYHQQSPSPDPLPKLLTIAAILSLSGFGLATLARSYYRPSAPAAYQPTQLPQTPIFLGSAGLLPKSSAVTVSYRKISGEALYLTVIDLSDPQVYFGIGLAHNAPQANSSRSTSGDEHFTPMVRRHHAAVTASGTFFSMDHQKRVMGNLVSGGKRLKYSPWENYGTTLGLKAGNRPEMRTARLEGRPNWDHHGFSLTAGPRLLKDGKPQIQPRSEGFTDRGMMEGKALRAALGYPKHGRTMLLVTFLSPLTLEKEAKIMAHLGCSEAMNLDGGTSIALAKGGKILQPAGRELTNVITIYDAKYPAPDSLKNAWQAFQEKSLVATRP
ncbi:MAG: phosphodiester glycosidase family protein [Alkalinema sp. RU_4_3]|nr:phosphodiester glycosidase family protein [Alkalinema sp. RU_4_3]